MGNLGNEKNKKKYEQGQFKLRELAKEKKKEAVSGPDPLKEEIDGISSSPETAAFQEILQEYERLGKEIGGCSPGQLPPAQLLYAVERFSGNVRRIFEAQEREQAFLRGKDPDLSLLHGQIANSHKVWIQEIKGGYRIQCPFRLPTKNAYRNNSYWWEPITWAVYQYGREKRPRRIREAAMVYLDWYPPGTAPHRFIDADNMDIKKVTDAVGTVFIESDMANHCWLFQAAGIEKHIKHSYTEIFILRQPFFGEWMRQKMKRLSYRKRPRTEGKIQG